MMPASADAHRSRSVGLLWLMACTVPCPVVGLLTFGLMPPVPLALALGGQLGREAARNIGTAASIAVYVIPEALQIGAYLWLFRRVARALAARTQLAIAWMLAVALVLLALAPIYYFDTMDGSPRTRCSVLDIALAAATPGRQCGDLGW